ncbi:hypothetical protein GQ53DRAFT_764242 [Thozetella sp. PMI_491]|nr:hypothetical protein GQ53DRAFT_764242 [Thozetella sp. PMI_491]
MGALTNITLIIAISRVDPGYPAQKVLGTPPYEGYSPKYVESGIRTGDSPIQYSSDYPGHVICGNQDCRQYVVEGTNFCDRHRCWLRGCYNEASLDRSFCSNHTCGSKGCPSSRRSAGYEYSIYCENHECKTPESNGTYCQLHECREGDCNTEAKIPGAYCRVHGCAHSTCLEKADGSRRCQRHHIKILYKNIKELSRRVEKAERKK